MRRDWLLNFLLGLAILGLLILIFYLTKKYWEEGFQVSSSQPDLVDIITYMASVTQPYERKGSLPIAPSYSCDLGKEESFEFCYSKCPSTHKGVGELCMPKDLTGSYSRQSVKYICNSPTDDLDTSGKTAQIVNNVLVRCENDDSSNPCPSTAIAKCYPICKPGTRGIRNVCIEGGIRDRLTSNYSSKKYCRSDDVLSTRYIRIDGKVSDSIERVNYLSIGGIIAIDENGNNVALHSVGATASSSSVYNNAAGFVNNPIKGTYYPRSYDADQANNGFESADRDIAPWWEVDLGREYKLQAVSYFSRKDCCPDRNLGFNISLLSSSRRVNYRFKIPKNYIVKGRGAGIFSVANFRIYYAPSTQRIKSGIFGFFDPKEYAAANSGLSSFNADQAIQHWYDHGMEEVTRAQPTRKLRNNDKCGFVNGPTRVQYIRVHGGLDWLNISGIRINVFPDKPGTSPAEADFSKASVPLDMNVSMVYTRTSSDLVVDSVDRSGRYGWGDSTKTTDGAINQRMHNLVTNNKTNNNLVSGENNIFHSLAGPRTICPDGYSEKRQRSRFIEQDNIRMCVKIHNVGVGRIPPLRDGRQYTGWWEEKIVGLNYDKCPEGYIRVPASPTECIHEILIDTEARKSDYYYESVPIAGATTRAMFLLDLKAAYEIDFITIFNRQDCCKERLEKFTLECYDENYTMTNVFPLSSDNIQKLQVALNLRPGVVGTDVIQREIKSMNQPISLSGMRGGVTVNYSCPAGYDISGSCSSNLTIKRNNNGTISCINSDGKSDASTSSFTGRCYKQCPPGYILDSLNTRQCINDPTIPISGCAAPCPGDFDSANLGMCTWKKGMISGDISGNTSLDYNRGYIPAYEDKTCNTIETDQGGSKQSLIGTLMTYRNKSTNITFQENMTQFIEIYGGTDYLHFTQIVAETFDGTNIAKLQSGENPTTAVEHSGVYMSNTVDLPLNPINGDINQTKMYHSLNSTGAFWRRNLGSEYSIRKITIYNRKDCCKERLATYKIRLLNSSRRTIAEWSLTSADVQIYNGGYKLKDGIYYDFFNESDIQNGANSAFLDDSTLEVWQSARNSEPPRTEKCFYKCYEGYEPGVPGTTFTYTETDASGNFYSKTVPQFPFKCYPSTRSYIRTGTDATCPMILLDQYGKPALDTSGNLQTVTSGGIQTEKGSDGKCYPPCKNNPIPANNATRYIEIIGGTDYLNFSQLLAYDRNGTNVAKLIPTNTPVDINGVRFIEINEGTDYLNFSQIVAETFDGTNVAKLQPGENPTTAVEHSGVYMSNTVDLPLNPINGDINQTKMYHSLNSTGAFWRRVFSRDYNIRKITIYNRKDCCQARLGAYKIRLLNASRQLIAECKLTGAQVQEIDSNMLGIFTGVEHSGVYQYSTKYSIADLGPLNPVNGNESLQTKMYHSSQHGGAFWRRVLDRDYDIRKIVIYNRADDCDECKSRFSNLPNKNQVGYKVRLLNASKGLIAEFQLNSSLIQSFGDIEVGVKNICYPSTASILCRENQTINYGEKIIGNPTYKCPSSTSKATAINGGCTDGKNTEMIDDMCYPPCNDGMRTNGKMCLPKVIDITLYRNFKLTIPDVKEYRRIVFNLANYMTKTNKRILPPRQSSTDGVIAGQDNDYEFWNTLASKAPINMVNDWYISPEEAGRIMEFNRDTMTTRALIYGDLSLYPAKPVRFVRIEGTSQNDFINISQIVVLNTDGQNVAVGKAVTSSGADHGTNPSSVVDGTRLPRDVPPFGYHSNTTKPNFIQIDLGADVTNIISVTIYNRVGNFTITNRLSTCQLVLRSAAGVEQLNQVLNEDLVQTYFTKTASLQEQIQYEHNAAMDLARSIYLGSPYDVDKYVIVSPSLLYDITIASIDTLSKGTSSDKLFNNFGTGRFFCFLYISRVYRIRFNSSAQTSYNVTIQKMDPTTKSWVSAVVSDFPTQTPINIRVTNYISQNDIKASSYVPFLRYSSSRGFCKPEIAQTIKNGDFVVDVSGANVCSNMELCYRELNADVLALIPYHSRNFIKNWVYNRTKRIIDFQITSLDSNSITKMKNEVIMMQPNSYGLDIKEKKVLDTIAQAFYEATNGLFTITRIHDVFPLGSIMLDVRFDMARHSNSTAIQEKIDELKKKFKAITSSTISQEMMDQAKDDYQTKLSELQDEESENLENPSIGITGRFFYNLDKDKGRFTVVGFTLDERAATSFIPELNCGIEGPKGDEEGNVNYDTVTKYTYNTTETLNCMDSDRIKQVMMDYVDAVSDPESSMPYATGTTKWNYDGNLVVTEVTGAKQVGSNQCAYRWKETVFDDQNKPKDGLVDVERRAIFTYSKNTDDWGVKELVFDLSGFLFLSNDTVGNCVGDIDAYIRNVGRRLNMATPTQGLDDYFSVGIKEGRSLCPSVNPGLVFDPLTYVKQYPDLNTKFNGGGAGPLNAVEAINHYKTTGFQSKHIIAPGFTIDTLARPVQIPKALPAEDKLETLEMKCSPKTCQDHDVLHSLVKEYNEDGSLPGVILRVTKAVTPNTNECQIETDINYDATFTDPNNSTGPKIKKGGDNIPAGKSGIVKGETFSFTVSFDSSDCSYSLEEADVPGTGTNIQKNTPALFKPFEYATEAATSLGNEITTMMNTVGDMATNLMSRTGEIPSAKSSLTDYRTATYVAAGDIGYLDGCPGITCSDRRLLNKMAAYFKASRPGSVIASVQKAGTFNANTCDLTFTKKVIATGAMSTEGARFTLVKMASTGPTACDFNVTSMTSIPSKSTWDTVSNMNQTLVSTADSTKKASVDYTPADAFQNYAPVVAAAQPRFIPPPLVTSRPDSKQGRMAYVEAPVGALAEQGFGLDRARNSRLDFRLGDMYEMPLFQPADRIATGGIIGSAPSSAPATVMPKDMKGMRAARAAAAAAAPATAAAAAAPAYKFLRFRPLQTRNPQAEDVAVGRFSFFLGGKELALTNATVSNPMGGWVGRLSDVTGKGGSGWYDDYKKPLVFAFPVPILVDGFSWTTSTEGAPASDPVRWKLEGSHNGTYWQVLQDQSLMDYNVPRGRGVDLPVFRFVPA